jgi:fermentation-respiration switch protein FrsA (DUF1100 family)
MIRRIVLIAGLLLVAAAALYCAELALPKRDYFAERTGRLQEERLVETTVTTSRSDTVHLVSSTGLEVDMRVRRPAAAHGKLPVVVLIGGHQTGKDAVDLVGTPAGVAFAAIDYPYPGDTVIEGFVAILRAVPRIQKAFIDTPPALSLALEWLLRQPWVDTGRVELVGVSLGVPFAAAAGAVDTRFSRVWLIHGGGDNQSWVEHAGRKSIPNDGLRRIVARAALFLVYGRSLETRDWIPEIAPRPVIVIAARDDDFVPPEAQAPFVKAAESDHVELIWTEGLHIGPERKAELQQLLDIVLARVTPAG